MALTILPNASNYFSQGAVTNATTMLEKSIKQLSTGLRINSASDDAAGMAVSEQLKSQISGMKAATRNLQDGESMLQVANAGMTQINGMISRMRELAIQSGNPAYSGADSSLLQLEVDNLKTEINRISNSVEFNGKKLLNGNASAMWVTSNQNVQAMMTGDVQNGNYNIAGVVGVSGTGNIYASAPMMRKTATGTTSIASGDTTLDKILAFQNSAGDSTLGSGQMLTLYANNKQISVNILGTDTLSGLATKLSSALGTLFNTNGADSVSYVSANGTLFFKPQAVGNNSQLAVSGNSALTGGLGFTKVATGTEARLTVTIAKVGGETKTVETSDGYVSNAFNGVTFKIDMNRVFTPTSRVGSAQNTVTQAIAASNANITITNTAPTAQYGANAGQVMSLAIGQVNTTSLGIDNLNVLGGNNQQAIGLATNALSILAKQSAQVGGKMNALTNSQTMLQVATENLSAARSRITDLDMAQATSEFAARQVILQSASAMLMQANMVPRYALQLISRF